MAVMAELLARGCNVAIPEIDIGEDVFAFQDGQRAVDRIQVKTATKVRRLKKTDRYTAEVTVPLAQLRDLDKPELHYIFPVRLEGLWTNFIVISRPDLNALQEKKGIGYENKQAGELQLHLVFGPEDACTCDGQDLSDFQNEKGWKRLPVLAASL